MVGSTPTFATLFISNFFLTFFSGVAGYAISIIAPDLSKIKNTKGVIFMKLGFLLFFLIGAGAANLGLVGLRYCSN